MTHQTFRDALNVNILDFVMLLCYVYSQTLLSEKIYLVSWLVLSNEQSGITISEEEKRVVIEGIIDTLSIIMQKVVIETSAKNRAKAWSRTNNQSKTSTTYDTILYNLLSGKQSLPVRPRDFRLNLSDEEKYIGSAELSDILTRLTLRIGILDRTHTNFPFRAGRPSYKSNLVIERRGRLSNYESSQIKKIIDEVLKDDETIKSINSSLFENGLYEFLRYSWATTLYQMKQDERPFLNTFRPVGISKKQLELNYEQKPGPWIPISDLSEEKLERLSAAYAEETIKQYKENGNNLIYLVAGLLYFGNAYREH